MDSAIKPHTKYDFTYRHCDRGVDTDAKISKEPGNNGSVDNIETNLREVPVQEVERQGKEKTNKECPCNWIVNLSGTEKFSSQTSPGDCTRVECLRILS